MAAADAVERPTDQSADIKEAKWDTRVNCKNHTCRVCGPLRKLYRLVGVANGRFVQSLFVSFLTLTQVGTNKSRLLFMFLGQISSTNTESVHTHIHTCMPKRTRAKSFPAVTVGGHGLAIKVR